MRNILLSCILFAALTSVAAAQTNLSYQEGNRVHMTVYGERGYGAGLAAGFTWFYGNGFSVSTGLDGEWNQRPNLGNNFFAGLYGEAKYSFLKGGASPFLAARVKARGLIPTHVKEGTENGFSRVSKQFDLFGIGMAGVDLGHFSLWGGIGGGPSFFTEEAKDKDLKVTTESHTYMDLTYSVGLTFWF